MENYDASIRLNGVTKSFVGTNGNSHKVYSGFDIEILGNKFFTLVGPNGCGKSTLLNLISGVVEPDHGEVVLTGKQSSKPKVGFVWQDYRASLLPWYSISENISFPLRIQGVGKRERVSRAGELIEKFMPNIDGRRSCFELSGGQQQLVSLLRALVNEPDLLLLDEPFSAMDQHRRWEMALYLESIWLQYKCMVLFVSHDVDEAVLLSDEIIVLNADGTVKTRLVNNSPRPRSLASLRSVEHLDCRQSLLSQLVS